MRKRENATLIRWANAVLANDEASTDAELVETFVSAGVGRATAEGWVARRGEALSGKEVAQ